MTETTQQGVDVAEMSVEDRLEAYIGADIEEVPVESGDDSIEEEAQAETDVEEVETSEEPEDETETVELDASQLAELLGLDPESLYVGDDGIRLKTKIDGEVGEATLNDLVKSYQLEGHIQKKSQALAEQQKAFEAEQQQAQAYIQQQIAQSSTLLQGLEQQLIGKYQSVDWEGLRRSDPAEYAALYAEYQNDVNNLNGMKQTALQTIEAQQQQMQANQSQQMQQMLSQQAEILKDKIPEWRDTNVAKKEKGEIVDWLTKRGYPEYIINGITDAQVVADIREFMQFKKAQESNKKSAKPVAKLQKPGARVKKANTDAKKVAQLRKKAREGDSDALTNLLLDRV